MLHTFHRKNKIVVLFAEPDIFRNFMKAKTLGEMQNLISEISSGLLLMAVTR